MNITWVVATGYQIDPVVDITDFKNIGPIWGSWSTWRSCGTDNVVCHDLSKARELVQREFQKNCNFYTQEHHHQDLGRPTGVRYYGGKFDQDAIRPHAQFGIGRLHRRHSVPTSSCCGQRNSADGGICFSTNW